MTLAKADAEEAIAAAVAGRRPWRDRPGRLASWLRVRADLVVPLGYLVVALAATRHLLAGAAGRIASGSPRGQAFDEWMLVHGAQVLSRGAAPFSGPTMSVPYGANPLAEHGFIGLSVPLAPLTLWLGATRTFAIAVTLCLAGTAWAWYHVLDRHLVRNRAAAIVGGAVGGFGPAMIAHAQGDLARVALFLVPFLIWRIVQLREPGHALRNGVVLGLFAAGQFLIDEQVLFLVGLGFLIFIVGYGIQRRAEVRAAATGFLRGLGVAVLTTLVLVGYPLFTQLSAPRWPRVHVFDRGTDLFSFVAFAMGSLGTWPVGQLHYAKAATEQNTFYGWPLLLLLVGSLFVIRTAVFRALTASAAVLTLLSLGTDIVVKERDTHVPGPWRLFAHLPGLRALPPTDLAFAAFPAIVITVALVVRWGGELVEQVGRQRPSEPVALAWWGLIAAALIPIAPAPIHTADAPVPAFVADGTWRSYVPAGSSLLTLPPGYPTSTTWRWAATTDLTLPTAEGRFNDLFNRAADSGKVQTPTDVERQDAQRLFARDHVSVVVLAPQKNDEPVRETTSALLGFYPQWVDGVWLWDLRLVS